MLESVALEYGIYKRAILGLYPDFRSRELRITGGGERSALWNQIKADVLDMSVAQVQGGGGAPLGAAMLACFGTGVHQDLPSAAEEWIETGQRYPPNSDLHEHYRQRVDRYEAALAAIGNLNG